MRDKFNLHTTERGSSENSPAPDESQTYQLFITKHVTYCNAITNAPRPQKKNPSMVVIETEVSSGFRKKHTLIIKPKNPAQQGSEFHFSGAVSL